MSSDPELSDWIWNEIVVDGKQPTPRQSHSGVICEDEWFIFGGFTNDGPLDDLWSLSFVSKTWKQIKKPLRSWPKSRHSHTASKRSIQAERRSLSDSMIVFGGVTENGEVLNDVWEFSFKKSSWSRLDTTGDIPTPRWGHSSVIHGDHLWIFGGFSDKWNNDLYCLDLVNRKWRKVNAEGSPQGRHGHSANIYANKMYVFGGLSWKNFNDMYAFDFATETWQAVSISNTIQGRRGHQAIVFDHYMVTHGGKDNSEATTDTCVFDFDSQQWSTLKEDSLAPSARFSHVACLWQNAIFIFGGFGVSKRTNLSDVYNYSFKRSVFSDVQATNGLFGSLPWEIMHQSLQYLNAQDLSRLSQVNRFFYFLSSTDFLWHPLFHKRFTQHDTTSSYYDAMKLENLLTVMRKRTKPNVKQFLWKNNFIQNVKSTHSWRPLREESIIDLGFSSTSLGVKTMALMVGSPGVGKSATTIQFTENHWVDEYDPTINSGYFKTIAMPGYSDRYVFFEVDDGGWPDEDDRYLHHKIRYCDVFVVMYSICDWSSFQEVENHIQAIKKVKEKEVGQVAIVLVGNKRDLATERQVNVEEGIVLAQKYDIPFMEASAKTRFNVEEQFVEVTREHVYKLGLQSPKLTAKKDTNCVVQ